MKLVAMMATQSLLLVQKRMTAQTVIRTVAFHLERRPTRPPLAQSRNMRPNKGWYQSHSCNRGELRAAAHAAIRMNTVVGRPGTNTPITPAPGTGWQRPAMPNASAWAVVCAPAAVPPCLDWPGLGREWGPWGRKGAIAGVHCACAGAALAAHSPAARAVMLACIRPNGVHSLAVQRP